MRLWTSCFSSEYEASPHGWVWKSEYVRREMDLEGRREALRHLELESYAAIGRMVCEALEQGTRSYVDLGHDVVARFVRVIEVTTPAYPELSE